MRGFSWICLGLAAITMAPGDALAQRGFGAPGSVVYPINDNVFEVVGNSGRGYILFWCGASRYARQVLGIDWRSKITIVRGLGRSEATGQRSAVQFTVNPGAVGVTPISSYSPNAYEVGDSKTATEANGFCHELIFPWRF